MVACGSDPAGPGSDATSFDGVVASQSVSGALSLSIATTTLDVARAPTAGTAGAPMVAASMAPVEVTGTLKIVGGSTIQLSGTYDAATHALSVSGGGYSFTGTFANGRIDGTFTTPTESGEFSLQSSAAATVRKFCGTFAGNNDHGHFNLAVNLNTGAVSGVGVSAVDGGATRLSGSVSGSSISITYPAGDAGGSATGTITQTSVSGSYNSNGGGDVGTWSGTVCQ